MRPGSAAAAALPPCMRPSRGYRPLFISAHQPAALHELTSRRLRPGPGRGLTDSRDRRRLGGAPPCLPAHLVLKERAHPQPRTLPAEHNRRADKAPAMNMSVRSPGQRPVAVPIIFEQAQLATSRSHRSGPAASGTWTCVSCAWPRPLIPGPATAQTTFPPHARTGKSHPHCTLTAWTISSPRPLSASSPTSPGIGGSGLASQTKITTCARSETSHKPAGGVLLGHAGDLYRVRGQLADQQAGALAECRQPPFLPARGGRAAGHTAPRRAGRPVRGNSGMAIGPRTAQSAPHRQCQQRTGHSCLGSPGSRQDERMR